jgi:hypothetical protein
MEFNLVANITISLYTRVKAKNLKDALEIAKERDLMSIVHNAYETSDDAWIADELDGTPYNIRQE